jgi:uncharacterized protein (TIGR02217 family)
MAFHNIRFPERISYGAVGGPRFSTSVVESASGYEGRNRNWSAARRTYDVSKLLVEKADFDEVLAFFVNRAGKFHSFRFKDWTDYQMERQQIDTGNGSISEYKIEKTYSDGLFSTVRHITKPIASTMQFWVDGVEQIVGTDCSVNDTKGTVTFNTPPADGALIEAQGEFDVPCRFDTDVAQLEVVSFEVYEWPSIMLVEVLDEPEF